MPEMSVMNILRVSQGKTHLLQADLHTGKYKLDKAEK